jgi:phage replication initiation protein
MLFGGASQRNTIHVQISGAGCKLVRDWLAVYTWGESNNVKLTRLDIAHDDHDGHQIDIASAIKWYDDGLFCDKGRPPKRHLRDDFNDGSGKTFYIGSRGNSRFARIYEKGKQLGDPTSKWCRAEIEFRAVDQELSWSAVVSPDTYFAGAYKALSFLTTRQSKFERIRREETIAFDQAVHWGRQNVGQLINLLCLKHDNDSEKVVADLRRDGIPKKLERYFALYIKKPRTE